jgi:hypothetical protein
MAHDLPTIGTLGSLFKIEKPLEAEMLQVMLAIS